MTILALIVLVGCKKKDIQPENKYSGTKWHYCTNNDIRLIFSSDTLYQKIGDKVSGIKYKVLFNDTILYGSNKYIAQIKGDTLTLVPPPYNVWSSKYLRSN